MGWHLHCLSLLACENVILSIASVVHVLGSDQRPYFSIIFNLLELLSIFSWIIILVQQVVGSTTMVLFTSIEKVTLSLQNSLLLALVALHILEALHLSVVPFLSQMSILVLNLLELVGAHSLVGHCEILVEALLLADEVSRAWVGVVHLCAVDKLMVTACTLSESRLLNPLLVLHGSLRNKITNSRVRLGTLKAKIDVPTLSALVLGTMSLKTGSTPPPTCIGLSSFLV